MKSALPIDQFRSEDLKRLRRQFMEEKIGHLVTESKITNEETTFSAKLKGKSLKDFLVTAQSKDPYHAKGKLIDKLTEKLNNLKNKEFTKPVSFERKAQGSKKELQSIAA